MLPGKGKPYHVSAVTNPSPNGRKAMVEGKANMSKWFIAILAVVGCMFLINHYMPGSWGQGLSVRGHLIPFAGMMLGGVFILALRLKSK
jgi:drug/metabolite transporter (DMT)-like permease